MGANANVFLFDYEAYIREVVPTFHRLIRTAEVAQWLQDLLAQYPGMLIELEELDPHHCADLLRYCTYLAPDLAWNGDARAFDLHCSWQERACASKTCPERVLCPFHLQGAISSPPYELTCLFRAAIAAKSLKLGQYQFLGHSRDILHFEPFLREQGAGSSDTLWNLLYRLGRRGFIIGSQWANFDGIHGWLDGAETRDLFQRLDALDLPRFGASFEAMRAAYQEYGAQHRAEWPLYAKAGAKGKEYISLRTTFTTLSLAFCVPPLKLPAKPGLACCGATTYFCPNSTLIEVPC